ncbi:hypothetical protein GCM10027570_16040 [Streptomonospora sediminis]
MRLTFTGADPRAYLDSRSRIIAAVAESSELDPAVPPAAFLAPVLDFKYGLNGVHNGDGRLALWRDDHIRDLLLSYLPRVLVADEPHRAADALLQWLGFLDDRGLFDPGSYSLVELRTHVEELRPEFHERLADPARLASEAFWAREMAAHGINDGDPDAVDTFIEGVNDGRVAVDTDTLYTILEREIHEDTGFESPQGHVLPVVDTPAPDEAAHFAAQTPVVTALVALDSAVGAGGVPVREYRELTEDSAARLASVAVPGLSAQRIVDIAAEIGTIRSYRGHLVPVKKNRALVRHPDLLLARALRVLPDWDRIGFADPEDDRSPDLAIDPGGGIAQFVCTALYQAGGDGFAVGHLVDEAAAAFAKAWDNTEHDGGGDEYGDEAARPGTAAGTPDDTAAETADETTAALDLSVRRMCRILVSFGAAELVTGPDSTDWVRATPAGMRGLRDHYTGLGFTAYSSAELAAEPAELLVCLVDSGLAGDDAVAAWADARTEDQSAAELVALAERTDDPDHEAIALHVAVHEAGDTGMDKVREWAADPERGGFARRWLATNGFMKMEELSKDDWLLGLLQSLESVTSQFGAGEWESGEALESAPELATIFADLPELLSGQEPPVRTRARRVTERIVHSHPDPHVTEAARSALAHLGQ